VCGERQHVSRVNSGAEWSLTTATENKVQGVLHRKGLVGLFSALLVSTLLVLVLLLLLLSMHPWSYVLIPTWYTVL
jgi:hypothetical protein